MEEFNIKDNKGNVFSAEKLLLEGQRAYNKKDYELALRYYNAIIEYYPDDKKNVAWAYYEIGYVYYIQEDYEDAKNYFTIVINNYPDQKDACALAGYILSKIQSDSDNNT